MLIVNGEQQKDLAISGDFTDGTITVGVEDALSGTITAYGHATGSTQGGKAILETAADHDGTISSYIMDVSEDDLLLGPATDPDALKYDGGSNQWQFSSSGGADFANGNLSASSGTILIGVNDTTFGLLNIYGGAASVGGIAQLYVGADDDATISYYRFSVSADDLLIGPSTNTDALKYDGGINQWIFTSGIVGIGVDDTTPGFLFIYGDNDDQGGEMRLYTPANFDTTIEYFRWQVDEDNLTIGPSNDFDAIKYFGTTGILAFTGAAGVTTDGLTAIKGGTLDVGVSDTQSGLINLYGHATGSSQGGKARFHINDDDNASLTWFDIDALDQQLKIGPSTEQGSLTYDWPTTTWRFTEGLITIGSNDALEGQLILYGDAASSIKGGSIDLYTAADHDTTIGFYSIDVTSDDLIIGPNTNPDSLKYDGGTNTWIFEDTVVGAPGFVDRGDPASLDFQVGNLTTDGVYNDLDLSSIVPAGAVLVLMHVRVKDGTVSNSVAFRKNGNSNGINQGQVRTVVANVFESEHILVACDANRVIEYQATNTTWTTIDIGIRGWWI